MSFHGHPPGLRGTTTGLDLFPHFIKLPATNTPHLSHLDGFPFVFLLDYQAFIDIRSTS